MNPAVAVLMDVNDDTGDIQINSRWLEAVNAQGLEVLRVDPTKLTDNRDIRALLDTVGGILLPGGNTNIHPVRYGRDVISPREIFGEGCVPCHQFSHDRDRVSAFMVKYALETEKPLLGVCRDMQELNVALGGTMQQRIYDHDHGYQSGADWQALAHSIDIRSDSLLAEAFGYAGRIQETSIHRQGMFTDDISRHLEISAMADDGRVVEAIEHPSHPFMLGVQFHAELQDRQPLNGGIFKSFAGAIRAGYQNAHEMVMDMAPIVEEHVLSAE